MITITQGPDTARHRAYTRGVSMYHLWVAEEAATLYEKLRKRANRSRRTSRDHRYWDGYKAGVKAALQGMVDAL